MKPNECPECGEETVTNKVRPYVVSTHCPHCLWSDQDDPLGGLTEIGPGDARHSEYHGTDYLGDVDVEK